MSWTYKSRYAFGDEGCTCTRGRGDSVDCPLHQDEYALRQAGCSCWCGYRMPDGSSADPECRACYPMEDTNHE